MELFKAHDQWSKRPADERFPTLQALYDATRHYADTARERADVRVDSLRVENVDGAVQLVGKGGLPAALTHWSFGQLASRVQAPASYLRSLPATLAAQNLNHGLARRLADGDRDATVNLLFHINDAFVLRALTSDKYERIWNYEIAERLLHLQSQGWEPALPDIRVDMDPNGPRPALYASDHDLFAFIRNRNRTINEPGNPDGLQRGLIAENSEVGASKLVLTRFLYREMCGNHIIWGAQDVIELSARHVGRVRDKLSMWETEIRRYMDASAADDEAMIARAKTRRIAATKEEVLDALFGKRSIGLSRATLTAGYEAVNEAQDGDPRTVWGMAQGLTRFSQTTPYADKRTEIDRAAGRLMDAF